MHNIHDTIIAISSASLENAIAMSIIRISGANARCVVDELFSTNQETGKRSIVTGTIKLDGLEVEGKVYSFFAPRSYTGQDTAEIHLFASAAVVEGIFRKLTCQVRPAGPGEFTLRAYLNGKVDLSQAEAVAEIVSSSNKFQLSAAQKLLAGKLSETISRLREQLLDIMSLIEAGMDFSGEDIEFISSQDAAASISKIKNQLEKLLNSSIRYEEMIDMPSVGLAGASNAGKSSLLNALLGEDRSIISDTLATTRDVLTGMLKLDNGNCAMFDCAGLVAETDKGDILQSLAQQAAIETLNSADLVLFCIDAGKDDYRQDIAIQKLIHPHNTIVIATKCDLLDKQAMDRKLIELTELFGKKPIATSVPAGNGLSDLRSMIDQSLIELAAGSAQGAGKIAITERHRQTVADSIQSLDEAAQQIIAGNDEIAAMLLRAGFEQLAYLEREDIDEAVLDRIFANFCIGK